MLKNIFPMVDEYHINDFKTLKVKIINCLYYVTGLGQKMCG